MYEISIKEHDATVERFYQQPLSKDQVERLEGLREVGIELAIRIKKNTPNSREQSIALTKLEEAIMWANKSIAFEKPLET